MTRLLQSVEQHATINMADLSNPINASDVNFTPALGRPSSYNWAVLALWIFVIAGITGNVLVCLAVMTVKKLQNVTNYFLTSLAVADLLVCCVVMPLSIVSEFMGKHEWTPSFPPSTVN